MKFEIVFYRSDKGFVPVKDYLARYKPLPQEKERAQAKKIKSLAKIEYLMEKAAENNGIIGGSYSCSVSGFDFQKIRIKDGDNLIRILYFCFLREKLVLLNAYDKPDFYNKGAKKRIEKMIAQKMDEAREYYKDFIKNPQNYEKY